MSLLTLKQLRINEGALGADEQSASGVAAGDLLVVCDVSVTSGSANATGYNVPMSASALRQAFLQDLGGAADLRVTGAVGISGVLRVAGAVTGAAGTFTSLTSTGGVAAGGAITGATTVSSSAQATFQLLDVGQSGFHVNKSGTVTAANGITCDAVVSGAAGTFDALAGTALALQSGGITAAGPIAGASTIGASGLASLDGGINVNDDFTVNTDGAVVAVGINAGGAITGATTIAASSTATRRLCLWCCWYLLCTCWYFTCLAVWWHNRRRRNCWCNHYCCLDFCVGCCWYF
jgi:hypothetical protein